MIYKKNIIDALLCITSNVRINSEEQLEDIEILYISIQLRTYLIFVSD